MNVKKQNGITLMVLVITIVVILILVGVNVNLLLGEDGLLKSSKETKNLQENYASSQEERTDNLIEGVELRKKVAAMIGTTYYETLQEAIDEVPKDNTKTTVILLKDISENVSISEGKNVELDLKHKTITNETSEPVITLDGTLNMKNGTIKGIYTSKNPTILVNNSSTIDITNTTISRNSETAYAKETIQLYGDLNMASGVIRNNCSNAICTYSSNNSNIVISGGTISSESGIAIVNYGNIEISETAKISSKTLMAISNNSGATATITGGTMSSESSIAITNDSNIEISGTAEITSKTSSAIANRSGTTATITGGAIRSGSGNAINNSGNVEISGTAEISNNGAEQGTTSTYPAIFNKNGATVTISGGTIRSENSSAILNNSEATVTISGGIIRSENNSTIYNKSEATVTIIGGTIRSEISNAINNYGNVEISETAEISNNGKRPGYTSTYPTIYNQSEATATISGGTIRSEGGNTISNQSGAMVTISGGTIRSESSNAINNYGDVEISGTAEIQGYTSAYSTIYNQSEATVTISGGTISSEKSYAINNYGDLEISGGTINSKTACAIVNKKDSTLIMSGGTIKSTASDGIDNYGTLKISGTSTITAAYVSIYGQSGSNITISGGMISGGNGNYPTVWNKAGSSLTVTGGTIKSPSGTYGISNSGTAKITGGTISSKSGC